MDAVCECDKFPTKRAIRMANAIMLERLLVTGKYGSATHLAKLIGVSQPHVTQLLNMLNLSPAEIEAILFETTSPGASCTRHGNPLQKKATSFSGQLQPLRWGEEQQESIHAAEKSEK